MRTLQLSTKQNNNSSRSTNATYDVFVITVAQVLKSSCKACLQGDGGPQIGEVTCGGSPHLSCKCDQTKMRDYMDRWVQCSPYQAVNFVKQHFIPPATAWRFTKTKYIVLKKMQVVIPSDQGNKWIYGKAPKYIAFFMGHSHFGKGTLRTE